MNTHIVIDSGTCYTKLGFSINNPSIGKRDLVNEGKEIHDLDFVLYIGYEAFQNKQLYPNHHLTRNGQIEGWDEIEQFWEQCFFKYLQCYPEDHPVLITDPPISSPDNHK